MTNRKFRGKSIADGKYYYGWLVEEEPPLQCFAEDVRESSKWYIVRSGFADWSMPRQLEYTEVDIATVDQGTGKRDIRGYEIYSSDILIDPSDGSYRYLVVWNTTEACYQLHDYGPDMFFNEGGGEEYTKDDRDLGWSGVDMSVCDQLELIKEQ